jgi:NADH:ubiquinone reductase (H+-translocating)
MNDMKKPVKVVIVGGGYLAIRAARVFYKAIKQGDVEVTLISRENYQVFHGFMAEMVTGRVAPGHILSPLRRIYKDVKIHVGEIEGIHFRSQMITISSYRDGRQYQIPYDHLVLSEESVDDFASNSGMAKHAIKLKTYDDCLQLKAHILKMFEMAANTINQVEQKRLLTFFVAGGGVGATELAGELADYIRLLTSKEYKQVKRRNCKVILVQPGPDVISELVDSRNRKKRYPDFMEFATNHLKRIGVELITNNNVIWATPDEVILSNGRRIFTKTIISAVETKPSPFIESLLLLKDEKGRVETDSFMRVKGYQNVWAGGDCAAVPHPKGGLIPTAGLDALKAGTHISKNILRTIGGKELKEFSFGGKSRFVSLGGRRAVGEIWGMEFKGFIGWLIWRIMLLHLVPTWDRKWRLLADWCIWPFAGRDIVEMSEDDEPDYEITNHLYLPGETILKEGDKGSYIYLITEGEVELINQHKDRDEIVMTLGIGNYFGHINRHLPLTETIRSKTIVQAVSIKSSQAYKLKKILPALGNVPLDM